MIQSLERTGLLQKDEKGRKVVEGEYINLFKAPNEFLDENA